MPSLNDSSPGTTVRLIGIAPGGPENSRRRLREFGFVPGADLTVVTRGATGGVLVGIGATRVALDADTAERMRCAR
ncbi:FeoA family protein [Streptomyces sp. BI20]|uniref:FeoA family protein n=1 Tax=Streptomyces sp. BI20 TaxID=3403460 RepID=UPI003C74F1A3